MPRKVSKGNFPREVTGRTVSAKPPGRLGEPSLSVVASIDAGLGDVIGAGRERRGDLHAITFSFFSHRSEIKIFRLRLSRVFPLTITW
jgi:hypothetical protein